MKEAVLRLLSLACVLFVANAWADEFAARRARSMLMHDAQDRQFVYQQLQITQALLRSEESTRLTAPAPSAMPFTLRRGLELTPSVEHTPSADVRRHREAIDRLEWRLRDLEMRRAQLEQQLSARLQRTQDP